MAYSPDSFTAGEVPTTAKWNKLWSNDADFDARITNSAPVGVIAAYGGTTAPAGWLLCDGSAVSRSTYASLFAVIGTAFGAGDGSTTFNLPNGKGRNFYGRDTSQTEFDVVGEIGGAKTHTLTEAQLPILTGSINQSYNSQYLLLEGPSGIVKRNGSLSTVGQPSYATSGTNPSASNGFQIQFGGGIAHNILGPYQVAGAYIIKT